MVTQEEHYIMNEKLMDIGTAIDQAIGQIELVLRSGQVGELAAAHLKGVRDTLQEAMYND